MRRRAPCGTASIRPRSYLASVRGAAMLTATGHTGELKLHVKGALNNGVTVAEIKAVLIHATAYSGIPAGLNAFKAAHEVLVKEGAIDSEGKPG